MANGLGFEGFGVDGFWGCGFWGVGFGVFGFRVWAIVSNFFPTIPIYPVTHYDIPGLPGPGHLDGLAASTAYTVYLGFKDTPRWRVTLILGLGFRVSYKARVGVVVKALHV